MPDTDPILDTTGDLVRRAASVEMDSARKQDRQLLLMFTRRIRQAEVAYRRLSNSAKDQMQNG